VYPQLQIHSAYARIREHKRTLYENRNTIHACGWTIKLPASAAGPMAKEEASPTIKERLAKDTSTDTLMRKEDEFYYIKDNDCDEVQRIHITRVPSRIR
jgi:hypothetical protein